MIKRCCHSCGTPLPLGSLFYNCRTEIVSGYDEEAAAFSICEINYFFEAFKTRLYKLALKLRVGREGHP